MTKVFTQDDLLRYIYGETSEEQNILIEALIATDSKYKQLYNHLFEMKQKVQNLSQKPSEQSIGNILTYSKEYDLFSV